MQTATSETEVKSRDLSICVLHYTLRAPCPKGQGNLHTVEHCTAQIFSLWGVALRPWCGYCPAHSHLGRDQCYASQAVSDFPVSDTKQQSTNAETMWHPMRPLRKATGRQHTDNAHFPWGRRRRYHPE